MIPIRVGVALMILGALFGWLVGLGASPWFLAALPLVTYGFVSANKRP